MYQQAEELAGLNYRTALRNIQEIQDTSAAVCRLPESRIRRSRGWRSSKGMRRGEILDGKYEILKVIGKGGMSVVYLAMDIRLHKYWAVKEISRTGRDAAGRKAACGLLVEAAFMKAMDHPALPRIVDILEKDRQIYLIMDYIEGDSLYGLLQKNGPFSERETADIGIQLCDVLQYLHTRNPPVIYRDMKPSNVIRRPGGKLALIDFGIAREYKEDRGLDTAILGTEGYAAPEQHGTGQSDQRTDIFALGMTLIHLLTGTDPKHDPYLYRVHPLRKTCEGISEGMEVILNKCTAFRPEDRYQSCLELKKDLENPEKLSAVRKRKKNRKQLLCSAFCVSLVLSLSGGIVLHAAGEWERGREYRTLLSVPSTVPCRERVQGYKKAIELEEKRPEAYLKLLQAWQGEGFFTEEESRYFTSAYNRNLRYFQEDDPQVLELNYQAGVTFLYLYTGGDGSFRTRILKSDPFFRRVTGSGCEEYANYSLSETYCLLGDFYKKYVCNAVGVYEPGKKDYTNLLQSFHLCLQETESSRHDGADYVGLLMDREMLHILNDQRRGLAAEQISLAKVLNLVSEIRQDAGKRRAVQNKSSALQTEILSDSETCRKNISRTYENVKGLEAAP